MAAYHLKIPKICSDSKGKVFTAPASSSPLKESYPGERPADTKGNDGVSPTSDVSRPTVFQRSDLR